jgi:hypothetical protein
MESKEELLSAIQQMHTSIQGLRQKILQEQHVRFSFRSNAL